MGGKYPVKFLPDGMNNPAWKVRNHGTNHGPKRPPKILPDGTINLDYKPHKGGKTKSLFERGNFLAWDGEGTDTGRVINGAREQLYTLLANSLNQEISNSNGLTTKECLDFIIKTGEENKNYIHVIFGGSYDANMILRDLPKEKILLLCDDKNRNGVDYLNYKINYTQRKYLEIYRFRDVNNKFKLNKKSGKYVPDYDIKVTLWDVFGFFQTGFIGAVEKWLGEDYPGLAIIKEGKAKRNVFASEDAEFIKKYNRAELAALVKVMEELQACILKMELSISRWDGAGAIASAMFKKHEVKKAFSRKEEGKWVRVELPPPVQEAAEYAYFGGRIEVGKIGHYIGDIFHYDINSAYPSIQCDLPALTCGEWHRRNEKHLPHSRALDIDLLTLPKMSICLVQWNFTGTIWGPFPYRSGLQNMVLFPEVGTNWVWLPEVLAAAKVIADNPDKNWTIKIKDCYEFLPNKDNYLPYDFMRKYYIMRQEMVKETKEKGIPHGEEKIIKLGLNSGYGKTAQHTGYNPETKLIPPYHNLAYAGYITSGTRAKIYLAAMQVPESIISIATDGIFSISSLELDCPKGKVLGAWGAEVHDEIILVQSGFYYYRNGEKWVAWTRGFDKIQPGEDYQEQAKKQFKEILDGWGGKVEKIYFPCTRFITMKSAVRGDNNWSRWCGWYALGTADGSPGRALDLCQHNTKRRLQGDYQGTWLKKKEKNECDPAGGLIDTIPIENYAGAAMGIQYELPWNKEEDTLIDGVPIPIIQEEMSIG